ncbi:MAG: hypothetical protein H6730_16445 [Deltaproteobacteria bacterium]|nr:hypothetical protein [Deltaproteobacteria bacterium]
MSLQVFDVILLRGAGGGGGAAFSKNRVVSALFAGFAVSLYFVASPPCSSSWGWCCCS